MSKDTNNIQELLIGSVIQKMEEELNKNLGSNALEGMGSNRGSHIRKLVAHLGLPKTKERKDWFTENCRLVLEKQDQARLTSMNKPTEDNKKIYESLRKKAQQVCRQQKRNHLNEKFNTFLKNSDGELIENVEEKLTVGWNFLIGC